MHKYIAGKDGVPELVTQMQKYFLKGRPKIGSGLVSTNILIAHDKEIKEIIRDMKYSLERYKIRIRV